MHTRKLVSQNFSIVSAGNVSGDVFTVAAFGGSFYIAPPDRGYRSPYWGLLEEAGEELGLDLARTLPDRAFIDRTGSRTGLIRWLYGASANSADYAAVEAAVRAELARVADLSAARRVYNRLRPEGEEPVYELGPLAAYWARWADLLAQYRPPVWGDLGLSDGELAVHADGLLWTRSPRGWGRDVTPEDYSSWGVRPLPEGGGFLIVCPGKLPEPTREWLTGVNYFRGYEIGEFYPPAPWRWEGNRLRLPLDA